MHVVEVNKKDTSQADIYLLKVNNRKTRKKV